MTPPLAPPKGMLTTANFHVIQEARARTSSSVTSGAKRMPPLPGPRAMECWTRCPVKTSRRPSSSWTGMWTVISLAEVRSTLRRPSSRLRRVAASSKRASAASRGFFSCSSENVVLAKSDLRFHYAICAAGGWMRGVEMCAQEGLGGALGVFLPSNANDDNAFIFNGPRKRGPRGRLGEWAMGAHGRLSGSIGVFLKPGAVGGRAFRLILEKPVPPENPFKRIEHVPAGLAEERRKDREEFRS